MSILTLMPRNKPTQRSGPSVLDYLISTLGTLDAFRVCTFVTAWHMAAERMGVGAKLRGEDYASFWHVSLATVNRDKSRFRMAFPGWAPADLIAFMAEHGQEPGLTSFGRVPWCAASLGGAS